MSMLVLWVVKQCKRFAENISTLNMETACLSEKFTSNCFLKNLIH
jgi:hypothetical protein